MKILEQDLKTLKSYITCIGSVRGSCGTKHRTLRGAYACLQEDQKGCKRHGGYSDRAPVAFGDFGKVWIPEWMIDPEQSEMTNIFNRTIDEIVTYIKNQL